ncbi:MAG: hypothetical protein H6702_25525, partial [Myxococcales bacterium]|nr:hypothetical protein [Myxococcales bacterium]
CVVAAAGLQRAQGLDLPDAQTVWAPLLSAGGRGRLDVPIDERWSLVGTGDVRAAFSRTVLRVGEAATWTSWPLWILGSVGIAARL